MILDFRGYTVRRKWSDHLKDRHRRPKKTPQLPIHDRQTQLEIFAKQVWYIKCENYIDFFLLFNIFNLFYCT